MPHLVTKDGSYEVLFTDGSILRIPAELIVDDDGSDTTLVDALIVLMAPRPAPEG